MVNLILAQVHPDTAALRRYLVDDDFLSRADGEYWRTGGSYVPDGDARRRARRLSLDHAPHAVLPTDRGRARRARSRFVLSVGMPPIVSRRAVELRLDPDELAHVLAPLLDARLVVAAPVDDGRRAPIAAASIAGQRREDVVVVDRVEAARPVRDAPEPACPASISARWNAGQPPPSP